MIKEKKENMRIESIEIIPIQPEAADIRKIKHLNKTLNKRLPEETYLIKIEMQTQPFFKSMGYDLFIGSRQIGKYMVFKKGIFFKVNNPDIFKEISEGKIRFRPTGAEEFIDSGTAFIQSVDFVKKTLKMRKRLPTLQEALDIK